MVPLRWIKLLFQSGTLSFFLLFQSFLHIWWVQFDKRFLFLGYFLSRSAKQMVCNTFFLPPTTTFDVSLVKRDRVRAGKNSFLSTPLSNPKISVFPLFQLLFYEITQKQPCTKFWIWVLVNCLCAYLTSEKTLK